MTIATEETMTVSHSRVNFSHLPGPGSQKPPSWVNTHSLISLLSSFFDPGRKWIVARDMEITWEGKKYWTEVHILVVDCKISHDTPPWNVILQIVSSKGGVYLSTLSRLIHFGQTWKMLKSLTRWGLPSLAGLGNPVTTTLWMSLGQHIGGWDICFGVF